MGSTLEQLLAQEKPDVVALAKEKAANLLLGIHLAELRKQANLTQAEVAATLGVKQPTVANMEREGQDILISSLKKYIEAVGGKLSLNVKLPDGSQVGLSL